MFTKQRFLSILLVLVFLFLVISCKGKEEHPPEHNMQSTHDGHEHNH